MFQEARIKLTLWYLIIIMLISISFSMIIFRIQMMEVGRFVRDQRMRIERQFPPAGFRNELPSINSDLISEIADRLIINIIMINGVIFIISGGMGYLLAGKTLQPIKDMMEEQSRFISDSSHELRTPLTSLKTTMEVALMDKKLTLRGAKQLIAGNVEDVNRLQKLADSLIQLTKSGSSVPLEKQIILARSLIDTSVQRIKPQANKKHIVMKKVIRDFKLSGNYDKLCNLLLILLDNAIKYSPENKDIIIKSWKTKRFAYFSVRDHGIGIEEKDISHIFDRFYRSESSRSVNKAPGYGLGLSIAKMIADEHNGLISVSSVSGGGSTFTIKLPIQSSIT